MLEIPKYGKQKQTKNILGARPELLRTPLAVGHHLVQKLTRGCGRVFLGYEVAFGVQDSGASGLGFRIYGFWVWG